MFRFFFAHILSECNVLLQSSIGLQNYDEVVTPDTSICINISVFDFFVVLNNYPPDLTVTAYSSNKINEKSTVYSAENIPLFIHLSGPFGSCTLTTKKGGVFSISYGSLPNICRNGIIFSSKNSINLDFNQTAKWPFKIGNNDDICVVLTSKGEHNYFLDMKTEQCCDKLINYNGLVPNYAFSGNINNIQFKIDANKIPSVFRFISDDKIDSQSLSMAMLTTTQNAGITKTDFYKPTNEGERKQKCSFFDMVEVKVFAIAFGCIICFELVMGLGFYCLTKFKYNYLIFPSSSNKNKNNITRNPNDIMEPPGYYALDSIMNTYEYYTTQ